MTTYTARTQPRLFFDIETLANPENLALMPEPKAPGNLKDPAKIEAAIEEKRQELIENAALDPDYGKVLSIGYATSVDGPVVVHMVGEVYFAKQYYPPEALEEVVVEDTYTEKDLITGFWQVFADCRGACVGYNILGFDLPYLMARSMYLGVHVPLIPNLAKFRTDPVTDLMAIRYNWDAYKNKGLKQVCKLLGIPNDCPDVDGSQVKDLDLQTLRTYQASDVKLTIELFKRMNGVYFNL
jgi:DNA polymerase elongation subunit (family B)